MKRTQVIKAIYRMLNRHHGEAYFTALYNYWIKYDLTQCETLEQAKRREV